MMYNEICIKYQGAVAQHIHVAFQTLPLGNLGYWEDCRKLYLKVPQNKINEGSDQRGLHKH